VTILERCEAALLAQQYQTAPELAARLALRPNSVGAVLALNCQHRYARVKRRERRTDGGFWQWEYSTFQHQAVGTYLWSADVTR
jgi:hypothetical protein